MVFVVLYYIIFFVQTVLSYGTVYRLTKQGGDNGVALFGWIFVFGFVSIVPGLGVYLWYRYRHIDREDGDESR